MSRNCEKLKLSLAYVCPLYPRRHRMVSAICLFLIGETSPHASCQLEPASQRQSSQLPSEHSTATRALPDTQHAPEGGARAGWWQGSTHRGQTLSPPSPSNPIIHSLTHPSITTSTTTILFLGSAENPNIELMIEKRKNGSGRNRIPSEGRGESMGEARRGERKGSREEGLGGRGAGRYKPRFNDRSVGCEWEVI